MTVKSTQFWSRLLAAVLAVVLSPPVMALGLGEAQVRSYLSQPLNLRIKLISRSEAELATVTAGLASADDYRIIGLDRAGLNVPLSFMVVADLDDPHILVTSAVPVNDPVVQLVVEVVWSSGRMLRQYTVFLDPPTFASAAPLPQTRPAPEPEPGPPPSEPRDGTLIEIGPEPETVTEREPPGRESPIADETSPDSLPAELPDEEAEATAEMAEQAAEPVEETPLEIDSGPPFEPEAEAESEAVAQVPAQDRPEDLGDAADTDRGDPAVEPPAADTAEVLAAEDAQAPEAEEPAPAPAPEEPPVDLVFRAVLPEPERSGEVYGPVQRGETLWRIASDWGKLHGHAVNEVMLAIQQQNPGAFNKGNINSLQQGAILRMPTDQQVLRFSAREAMLEVMRQEELYRNRWDTLPDSQAIPTIADLPPEAEAVTEPVDIAAAAEDESRLELVPPAEARASGTDGLGQGNADDRDASTGESVVEELARAQEELANARQENSYLSERLEELEAELSRLDSAGADAADTIGGVEDSGLAEMEQRLRADRQSGQAEEIAVVPPSDKPPVDSRILYWAGGAVVVLVGLLIWWLRSRSRDLDAGFEPPPAGPDEGDSRAEPEIAGSEVLEEEATTTDNVIEIESFQADEEGDAAAADKGDVVHLSKVARPVSNEEAVELDSSDPETKLDLARAYLSMGDDEAARKLLEEVIETGDEEQIAAARELLTEP